MSYATNIALPPYEKFLLENGDAVHQAFKDSINCKLELIRKAPKEDIGEILNLFLGSTPGEKKKELVEFLKLMPEYRTTDSDLLYQRLKILQDHLRRTEGNSDLYFYALRKYRKTNENNEEG